MLRLINIIFFATLLFACSQGKTAYTKQLKGLDVMLEEYPRVVMDSLQTIEVDNLNKPDRAYYYLLEVAAKDKNFIPPMKDSLLRISEEHYKNIQDFHNLARTQYYLSKCLNNQGNKETAYDLLKQAEVSISQSSKKNAHLEGLIYFQLALIQKQQINIEESEVYYKKSLDKFLETQDTILATHALKQLGQVYINKKELDKAKESLNESLRLISLFSNEHSQTAVEAKAGTLSAISILYRKNLDISTAIKYAKESIDIFQRAKLKVPPTYYHNILQALKEEGNLDSIKHYSHLLINTAQETHKLLNHINGLKSLIVLEEQSGNYKEANRLKDQYIALKDTINIQLKHEKILELEKQYDLEKKEKLILQAKNTRLWLVIIILAILSVAAVVGLHFYYRHRKLKAEFNELSKEVKHTKWGFSVSKQLISDNHNTYEELEKILDRNRVHTKNPKLYDDFHEVFKVQKASYSTHLLATLTDFDNAFIQKIQKQYPDLTPEDVMMAAMIRHRWNTIDISAVFHSSTDAIRKRKSRLKNKILGKEAAQSELEEFLITM